MPDVTIYGSSVKVGEDRKFYQKTALKGQSGHLNKKAPDFSEAFVVVPPGFEPGTQGFSVLCSTD